MSGDMGILFVDPSDECLGRSPGGGKVAPLMGLACVATMAREAGYEVRAHDRAVKPSGLVEMARDFNPPLIGLTATSPFFHAAKAVARELRDVLPGAFLVLGGPLASSAPRACLEACPELDAVAVGEGEDTIVELARSVEAGGRGRAVKGIMRRDDIDAFEPRPLIASLDSLPFPDWSLFDYADYAPVYSIRLGKEAPLFQVQASRGCPNQCSFCYNIFGSSLRVKSAGRTATEVFHNHENYGARHFEFVDPVMPRGQKWFAALCHALETGPAAGRIAWGFETRTDAAGEEMFRAAARAGCERVLFGIESGSQAMLDRMGKRALVSHAWSAVKAARRAGLKVQATILVGHPGENSESVGLTLEMVSAMRAEFDVEFLPAFLAVYPGTLVHEQLHENNGAESWRHARRDRPLAIGGEMAPSQLADYMSELRALIEAPRQP